MILYRQDKMQPLRSSPVQHNSRKKETLEASRAHSLVVHRRARQTNGPSTHSTPPGREVPPAALLG